MSTLKTNYRLSIDVKVPPKLNLIHNPHFLQLVSNHETAEECLSDVREFLASLEAELREAERDWNEF